MLDTTLENSLSCGLEQFIVIVELWVMVALAAGTDGGHIHSPRSVVVSTAQTPKYAPYLAHQ